ncbi:MAG: hypothetical protein QXS20_10885, partial [Candidatus Thorarchaeota archaeon]
ETLGFRIQRYGVLRWGDMFSPRQALVLLTFVKHIRRAYEDMLEEGYDQECAGQLISYLALMLDRLAEKSTKFVRYNVVSESVIPTFSRQALPMVWDYVEINPFETVGWPSIRNLVLKSIESVGGVTSGSARVQRCSATQLPHPDEFFDAVITDPPYYDNVPYSYLSDFFYVWLKRCIGHIHPDLFITPLTPKKNEIVVYSHESGGRREGERQFEEKLSTSFQEINRVLRPGGVAVIVYAHKSAAGWEALVKSLIHSGLVVTAAWPINTEKRGRLRSQRSAALASSIYVVARKMRQEPTGFYREIRDDLEEHLKERLDYLWAEGTGGADFFIAAMGSAIEVFGRYREIIDYDGSIIRVDRLIEDARMIATDYAVRRVLQDGLSEQVTPLTRFYLLFRWYYKTSSVEFDQARKLAQSCGIDITEHWTDSFIRKENEFIRILGPHERRTTLLMESPELVDQLHAALQLWEDGREDSLMSFLARSGRAHSEIFWRIAQAISETLPSHEREKKLLDGLLSGRSSYTESAHCSTERLGEDPSFRR